MATLKLSVSVIAILAFLMLSGPPAKADGPEAPDIANLTGLPGANLDTVAAAPSSAPAIDTGHDAYLQKVADLHDQKATSDAIKQILALPEDKIDIGTAALTFAHEIYPHIDIAVYSKKLDALADEARKIAGPNAGPDQTEIAINKMFGREGFHYDFSTNAKGDWSNFFLPGILDTKHGICGTMPMLYMAVAQRMGLPIYPVAAPQHSFLRITDPRITYPNVEATSGGTKSDSSYIKEFHITDTALRNGTYMRTMTHHEYLAVLLEANADYYDHKGDYARSIKYYNMAAEIDPHSDGAALGLMMVYLRKSWLAERNALGLPSDDSFKEAKEDFEQSEFYRNRVKELGVRWEEYADAGNN